MKKLIILFLILLLLPIVYAQEPPEEEKCGLTNLAACIPEKFYRFTLNLINAPFKPLLSLTKDLLTEPVNVDIFLSLWAIINYIISLFYGLFLMFAGLNFIVSGYDSEKRERAKRWLRNIILMIFFIQASFYIYELLLELISSLSIGVIDLIDDNFFLLTVDNIVNLGLELVLGLVYLIVLLLYIIYMGVRYLAVSVGVVFFPIGIFLYFIPPLERYGKFIINSLLVIMALPFVHAIILLAASKLIEIPLFSNFKILIMIIAFALCIITIFGLTSFVKSSSSVENRGVSIVAKKLRDFYAI